MNSTHTIVGNNSGHKEKEWKNAVATISYNEYKDVLLNNKCLRYSMNIIKIKDHNIWTYEIRKI